MRKLLFFIGIMAFMISSCEKEDNTTTNPSGLWKVTKFTDNGKDETDDFKNYTFDFQENGKLIATIDNKTYTGVWNDNLSKEKMELKISGTQYLSTLNDDWLILEMTSTRLRLKDDDSENEEVLFTKL